MTLTEYPELEQRSEEWFALRRGIVTASVVGSLVSSRALSAIDYACPDCGALASSPCLSKTRRDDVHPAPIKSLHADRTAEALAHRDTAAPVLEVATGDTARTVTALLVAERVTGWTDDTYVSNDMWRGIDDEPGAIEKYSEHFEPVTTAGFMIRDDWGFPIGFSPDGLVGDDGLVEVKSRRPKKHVLTVIDGRVPVENMAQIQCGLLVSGRQWCDYISYAGGMHMWRTRVEPDPAWFEVIIAAAAAFEKNAAEMVAAYEAAVADMPITERVEYGIELKL